jgi:Domain of unknown function (DUF4281)
MRHCTLGVDSSNIPSTRISFKFSFATMLTGATSEIYTMWTRATLTHGIKEHGMDSVFRLSNFLVLPFWAFMILLPGWRWTERIIRSPLVSLAPAVVYGTLVLPRLTQIWPALARPTLGGVAALLGSPTGATIAWLHFLAFDLFVGRWIYLDSRERQVSGWFMAPVLFLTLMLGPAGFLLYLPARSVSQAARVAGKQLLRSTR